MEIQFDLLGDKNQDMTLNKYSGLWRPRRLESDQLYMQLLLPHTIDAITGSTYKHQRRDIEEGSLSKRTRIIIHTVVRRVIVKKSLLD